MHPDGRRFRAGLPGVGQKEAGVAVGTVGDLEAC